MLRFPRIGLVSLALVVLASGHARAQVCPGADVFEDDDDCASALVVASLPQAFTGRSLHGGGSGSGVDDDVYRFTVPAGELLVVDWNYTLVGSDRIDAFLYDAATVGTTCGNFVDVISSRYSSGDKNQLIWSNVGGNAADVVLQLHAADAAPMFDCVEYELSIMSMPDPCALGLDDASEDNDDCASAAVLGAGFQTDLVVRTSDRDFYRVSVNPQERVIVDVDHDPGYALLGVSIYEDSACAIELDIDSYTPRLTVSAGNATAAAKDYYIEVRNLGQTACSPLYDVSITLQPDDCQLTADDIFEPNDDCTAPALLSLGTHTGLFVSLLDEDHYRVPVAHGDQLVVDITKPAGMRELEVQLFADPGCTTAVDFVYTSWPSPSVTISNGSGAPKDYFLRVSVDPFQPGIGVCSTYELSVTTAPDPCIVAAVDDVFEQNDDCASHVFMTQGLYLGLFVALGDADFYRITVPTSQRFTATSTYSLLNGDLTMGFYGDATCQLLSGSTGGLGMDTLTYINDTGAPVDVFFSIQVPQISNTNCNTYDLDLQITPDACLTAFDDVLEPNDDCGTATPAVHGLLTGLFVDKVRSDFFRFDLESNGTLQVDVTFNTTGAPIDLLLYDEFSLGCGNELSPIQTAYADPFNGITSLPVQNSSGSTVTYYLQIDVWHGSVDPTCNHYDINFAFSGQPFGETICVGNGLEDAGSGPVGCPCANLSTGPKEGCLNSQGHGARITSSGSNVLANDDMVLELSQARPNQPAMLVQGSSRVAFPFRDGILCVGNPTERIEVVICDALGQASTTESIATEGQVSGTGAVRYYQFWYRDPQLSPCGSGSNFSAGLKVTFQ